MMLPEDRLNTWLLSGSVPHALLFTGAKESGAVDAAYQFAGNLICRGEEQHRIKIDKRCHPDIHLYFPEGKSGQHPIQTIRSLSQEVSLMPYEAKCKVFILYEAERMLDPSANALLKTLEEPAAQTVIILVTSRPKQLLPTIQSRCQTVEFPPLSKLFPLADELLDLLAAPTQNSIDKLAASIETKELAFSFFETILYIHRDRALLDIEGGRDFLTFPDKIELIKKMPCIPLEKVDAAIVDARLATERSMKFSICLEQLFLKLNH